MRNKVFVVVHEKRTFRIVSLKNESASSSRPLVPFRPSTRFKPLSNLPFSYFFFRSLRMHMILRMHHCVCARTSYTASYSTKVCDWGDCRKPTGDILPRLFHRISLFYPWFLFLFPVTNSYQFFVRLRLAKQGCRRSYSERTREEVESAKSL